MNNLQAWSPSNLSELVRRQTPFADLDSWLRERLGAVGIIGAGDFTPAAEVIKDGNDAVIRLELPGIDVENDVTVEIEAGQLTIHGERRDEHAEQTNGRMVHEVRYGSFRRSFSLPTHVTTEAVSASYDAGVLTVRVSNAYAEGSSQAHRIPISK